MRCEICNGKLHFKDGVYLCENCGSKYSNSQAFEKIDAFICYVESDSEGRRSADSVTANDIYNKLESKRINTFYQRISLDGIPEDDYDLSLKNALYHSKLVILFAKSKENFENLLNRYGEILAGKKILPVYSGMTAEELPAEINNLQALNYDKIASSEDIVLNTFENLGRSEELNIEKTFAKRMVKKRKITISIISVFLFLVVAASLYTVLFTPLVLNKNKYNYAGKLASTGHRIKAMQIYDNLGDYKDSKNKKNDIMDEYLGFYSDNDNKYSLTMRNKKSGYIEITCKYPDANFSATTKIKDYKSEFAFVDTGSNSGNGTLKLIDNGISINLRFDNSKGLKKKFYLKDKKDEKVTKINKDILLSWLSGEMTVEKLQNEGYELQMYKDMIVGDIYKLKEFPVEIICIDVMFDYTTAINIPIYSVQAPAETVAKDHIGQPITPFIEDEIVYLPGRFAADAASTGDILWYFGELEPDERSIESTTPICMVSKETVSGYYEWEEVLCELYKLTTALENNLSIAPEKGSVIKFGTYEQDNDESNGKEDIEWQVLDIKDGKMLVISKYALNCQPYNTVSADVTWQTCTLRNWLNNDFLNGAFSEEEQSMIDDSTVYAQANTEYDTDPGNDTTDKVFLLSINKANEYFSSNEERMCVPTAYAISNGAYTSENYNKGGEATCFWWICSYDLFEDGGAASVDDDGAINGIGCGVGVFAHFRAVRPAMWIRYN